MKVINFSSVLRGLAWALIISVLLSLLISLILHFTSISEAFLPSFATLIFFLSILLGSTICARHAGHKGLFHGLWVALIYFLISLILSVFFSAGPFSWAVFAKKIAYTILAGVLGGIIGIGLTNNN